MRVKGYDIKAEANLAGADLSRADLAAFNLSEANLSKADLSGANLFRADLSEANLSGANLFGADLYRANLFGANLSEANLSRANLCRTDLYGANLFAANLQETVLDPRNDTNNGGRYFKRKGNFVVGYRTRANYLDGRVYAAPWFSTCKETVCHPGLYLWPTLARAHDWNRQAEIIMVHTYKRDIHKAGDKYRCRWFRVVGTA